MASDYGCANWDGSSCGRCDACRREAARLACVDESPHDDFDLSDTDVEGPCTHVFSDFDGTRERCGLCGAPYDPVVHGHRILPGDDVQW